MRGPRNHAIERGQLARKAKPLGTFIIQQMHAKIPRLPSIPPRVPVVPAGDGVQSRRQPSISPNLGNGHKATTGPSREAPVLHACLKWLHAHGIFAWRNNSGTLWTDGQPISFGYPGSADITGILPDGRRLEVETKSSTGKQSAKQKHFQAQIEKNHGVYLLVRSKQDLEAQWAKLFSATVVNPR